MGFEKSEQELSLSWNKTTDIICRKMNTLTSNATANECTIYIFYALSLQGVADHGYPQNPFLYQMSTVIHSWKR